MHRKKHFHFVGINGIGMSGIAKIMHKQGHTVSGCDLACNTTNVQELINQNCHVSNTHNSPLCHDTSITTVVYSSDVSYTNPELIEARKKGIQTIKRAALLAEIMKPKFSIGVAGSHGKTTTSSMIGHILIEAQTNPTVIVGGIMHNTNNNAHFGTGEYVVAETDESDRSLLLPINLAVVTNIDYEHANTYKNIDEVVEIFTTYINKVLPNGKAVVCSDDKNILKSLPNIITPTILYGTTNQADIQAVNIILEADTSTFDVIDNRTHTLLGSIKLPMPSIYNVTNAVGAITTALELKIPWKLIVEALESFQGVDRRFSYKGTIANGSVDIFDDYGHHPTEIYHSLITARRKTKNNLIVVFQPQRYTRTFHLWNEFVETFANSDITHLIITDIYPASEQPIEQITGKNLADEIQQKAPGISVYYIPFDKNLEEIEKATRRLIKNNDLILLLGAGKINNLADKLL